MDSCEFENVIKSYLEVSRFLMFLLPETPLPCAEDARCPNQLEN